MAKAKTTRRRPRPKKKARRKAGMRLPLALLAGAAVGPANLLSVYQNTRDARTTAFAATAIYTGIDPGSQSFDFRRMWSGTLPLLMGAIVHKVVGGSLGVNRMIASSGIPLIRI